ncbi:MAG: DUF3348 domain-containing protein [Rhodocyclaceae bacterium]|nr:DUF3348 domain-containing protein [Rhodocyclaceae bacterium]MBX3666844.1 DUF3348 domain-containing protein [Rhodocyclaceae bacterium]
MTRASPRPNFNSSKLLRFLADLSIADASEPKQSFAERLGEWVDFTDAITLLAALGPRAGGAGGFAPARLAAKLAALEADLARIQATLVNSISRQCRAAAGSDAIGPSQAERSSELEEFGYASYRRMHQALQREMDGALRPLREALRATLAQAGPDLQQLAALDEALDKVLAGRERSLLGGLPAMLEKRFEQLLAAHRGRLAEGGQVDLPNRSRPGAWQAQFCAELQRALLAELDLRLQPVSGLIEALRSEAVRQQ